MSALIETEQLAIGYPGVQVASGISFSVEPSSFWFLVGANGSGKSTLVKTVAGIIRPLEGTLCYHPELDDRSALAYVPQVMGAGNLLPVSVREFVSLGLPGSRKQARAVEDELERFGLSNIAKRSIWKVSGGQQKSAAVARALLRKPKLLILDEAFDSLDDRMRDIFVNVIEAERKDRGMAVLFVTHHLADADSLAAHSMIFSEGRVETKRYG